MFGKQFLSEGCPVFGVLLLQKIKIRADPVHLIAFTDLSDLIPELMGAVIAKTRDQTVFLHILRAECLIKIIKNCGFFHNLYYSMQSAESSENKKRPETLYAFSSFCMAAT